MCEDGRGQGGWGLVVDVERGGSVEGLRRASFL